MRKKEIDKLSKPYINPTRENTDRRFHASIDADVPSAGGLAKEIFNDLDPTTFGVIWWSNLPVHERILIGDYLYQCADDIETNLAEAKLHYFEWLDARESENKRIVDSVSLDSFGKLKVKMPPAKAPIDNLPSKLEKMHICGFFRAIGSSLDCLGGAIIGVLALPIFLRRNDIKRAETALKNIKPTSNNAGIQLQLDFKDFFEKTKISSGKLDWLEWADQYRNMFVHRGRRITTHPLTPRENIFYDVSGKPILRATSQTHLAKYPDRSEIEAFIKNEDIVLNEDAEITLNGIFESCRTFTEVICKELILIWQNRRNNPALLEQPIKQWNDEPKECNFAGYGKNSQPFSADELTLNPVLKHRLLSASIYDSQRKLWDNTKWDK